MSYTTRQLFWRNLGADALTTYLNGSTVDTSFGTALAAGASGWLYGWTHAITNTLITNLLATRNPDGGYGLGRPYDAFANGSVNPATTTYAVTLAGHVGPTLARAFAGGSSALDRQDVQDVVDLLVHMDRVTVPRGEVVAYSNAPGDDLVAVWNVSAGVGWFLSDVNAQGFGATGMQKLITNITISSQIAYREDEFWWPYLAADVNQDADHNSYTAESAYRLFYWPGREVAYRMMSTDIYPPGTSNVMDPIVHTRLAGLPGGNGSWSRTTSGVTLWAEMSDRWRAEQTAYGNAATGDRAAQFAYYAMRASAVSL